MAHDQDCARIGFPCHHASRSEPGFLWGIFLVFCLFPSSALAGEVTLAWDPPTTEYGGFILAYGTSSGSYTQTHDVGAQAMYTVTSLNPGQTYYFAVKAYDSTRHNESPYSNQVSVTLPIVAARPASPKNVQIN